MAIAEDLTEKVENQQLGLVVQSEQYMTATLNSNINIWKTKDGLTTPS